jgi:hypothetical protein
MNLLLFDASWIHHCSSAALVKLRMNAVNAKHGGAPSAATDEAIDEASDEVSRELRTARRWSS